MSDIDSCEFHRYAISVIPSPDDDFPDVCKPEPDDLTFKAHLRVDYYRLSSQEKMCDCDCNFHRYKYVIPSPDDDFPELDYMNSDVSDLTFKARLERVSTCKYDFMCNYSK